MRLASAERRLYFGVMHGFHDFLLRDWKRTLNMVHANLIRKCNYTRDSTFMSENEMILKISLLLTHEFELPFTLSLLGITVLAYHPDVSLYICRFPAVHDNDDSCSPGTFPPSSGTMWVRIEEEIFTQFDRRYRCCHGEIMLTCNRPAGSVPDNQLSTLTRCK